MRQLENTKSTVRWIAHVDMDSFYVSVERLKNPKLIGKPVAVGGKGPRSVISSASYEARKFGVRSAMPTAQALRACRSLIVVEPNMSDYSMISHKIFSELEKLAPVIEQVSVDEAYLDFTGCERLFSSRFESAEKIREAVMSTSKLTASVGVGTNKLITKIASDLAKPNGIKIVPEGDEAKLLAPLSLKKIPGIGPKTLIIFERLGVMTCQDLVAKERTWLKDRIGSFALELQNAAQGIDDSEVNPEGERKSLGSEITFDVDVTSEESLIKRIKTMSDELSSSLRDESLAAKTVQIKMRYSDFTTVTRARTRANHTDLAREISETAIELLKINKVPGVGLRLLGVSVRNFADLKASGLIQQFNLFEDPKRLEKESKIEKLKDDLRRKFGEKIVRRLGDGDGAE